VEHVVEEYVRLGATEEGFPRTLRQIELAVLVREMEV